MCWLGFAGAFGPTVRRVKSPETETRIKHGGLTFQSELLPPTPAGACVLQRPAARETAGVGATGSPRNANFPNFSLAEQADRGDLVQEASSRSTSTSRVMPWILNAFYWSYTSLRHEIYIEAHPSSESTRHPVRSSPPPAPPPPATRAPARTRCARGCLSLTPPSRADRPDPLLAPPPFSHRSPSRPACLPTPSGLA